MLCAVALVVSCTPATVARGETVSCAARLDRPAPFVVTSLRSEAEGHVLRDDSEKHVAAELDYRGPAVTDTRVTVVARTLDGRALRGSASFAVMPRARPRLQLPPTPPAWEYGPDAIFGGWPPRVRTGSSAADPIAADGSLGQFDLHVVSPRTRYVEEGPDARWFYVAEAVPQPVARVRISRALRPDDAFYLLQNGGPVVALRPGCGKADLDELRDRVLRHEGALPSSRPSHWSETRRAFDERDLQAEVEELRLFYDQAVAGDPLQKAVDRKLQGFLDGLALAQRETVDAVAPVRLPCRLRYP